MNIEIPSNIFHMQPTLKISPSNSPEADPGGRASLRRKLAAASMLGLQVRILLRTWNFVSCVVLYYAGSGLCEGMITPSEESFLLCLPNWV
jgi:hypothetical protein